MKEICQITPDIRGKIKENKREERERSDVREFFFFSLLS